MHFLVPYAAVFIAGLFGGGWFRSEVDDDAESTGSRLSRNAIWAIALVGAVGAWQWMRKRS